MYTFLIAASQIAEMAQRQGLGTVETIDSTPEHPPSQQQPGQPNVRGQGPAQFPGLTNQQQAGAGRAWEWGPRARAPSAPAASL